MRLRDGARALCATGATAALTGAATTAQAVLCLRLAAAAEGTGDDGTAKRPWHLFCLPHRAPDQTQAGWSSSRGAIAAQLASRVVGAVALPRTPPAMVLQGLLAHTEHLYGYALREVSPWAEAVLVPMDDVLGPVTVVPVLPEHPHACDVQRARDTPLVFLVDDLH